MFHIVMSNPGGELARAEAEDSEGALRMLKVLLDEQEELLDGDTFTITDDSPEE